MCVSGIEACPDTKPCQGKSCGDTCSLCAPGEACPPVVMYCDADQTCQLNQPVCETNGCNSDDDCPGVGVCPPCPDGMSCAELRCVMGACQFQCPSPGGMCSAQGESCAQGETCCEGLSCCAGMPTPPGEEFCGKTCPISDRNLKHEFASIDQGQILDKVSRLPISTWAYTTDGMSERHIGPMAQDFMATFGVGSNDRTILQVDADGVALASIQALYQRLQRLERKNAELEGELQRLKRRPGHER
jgi:hypothetical protein